MWKEHSLEDPPDSISQCVDAEFGLGDMEGHGVDVSEFDVDRGGLRALAHETIRHQQIAMTMCSAACQSPIERAMFYALVIEASTRSYSVVVVDQHLHPTLIQHGFGIKEPVVIQLQAQLGDYRVDFCLRHTVASHDAEGRATVSERRLVVECDGHDFHDRTKEQASRDRERDRVLQSTGVHVFRFTGADIWRDAFRCAREAVSFVAPHHYSNGRIAGEAPRVS